MNSIAYVNMGRISFILCFHRFVGHAYETGMSKRSSASLVHDGGMMDIHC